MTHRFPIKEIAIQAGMSTATVDRVLNARPNVSPQTHARVGAAIAELELQEAQLSAKGRRMFFDFVIEAPARFSSKVKTAAESVISSMNSAVCRPRFLLQEIMSEQEVVDALARIGKRGSQGVCLKARDLPSVRDAIGRLNSAGIPVVTLVTDIPKSDRLAYVGADNVIAGRTAAFLVSQSLSQCQGYVLTITSQSGFLGEEARGDGFHSVLLDLCPDLQVVAVTGGSGTAYGTTKKLEAVINEIGDVRAVYSMGGGNKAALNLLDKYGLCPQIFIGHDLDTENVDLLRKNKVDYILHHDLEVDIRRAFELFLAHHGLISRPSGVDYSPVEIVTRFNMPPNFVAAY